MPPKLAAATVPIAYSAVVIPDSDFRSNLFVNLNMITSFLVDDGLTVTCAIFNKKKFLELGN